MASSSGTNKVTNAAIDGHKHVDLHRRFFIGPLPEKIISQTEHQVQRKRHIRIFATFNSESAGDDAAVEMINTGHAFKFFTEVQGGKFEDWDESTERSTRQEMVRRWKDSEWGTLWRRRRKKKISAQTNSSRWVGGSFQVGTILGVNFFEDVAEEFSHTPPQPANQSVNWKDVQQPLSTGAETFATAQSQFYPFPADGLAAPSSIHVTDHSAEIPPSTTSRTALLEATRNIQSAPAIAPARPALKIASETSPAPPSSGKGKGKGKVHYADSPQGMAAPPHQVLERSGSAVHNTSAGATESAIPDGLKDRMLIRVSYTRMESLGPSFDEAANRTTSNLHYEDWAEFVVAWRKDRLEIYEDYGVPGFEWMKGHKRLAFVVPLSSSRTKLSLYSFVDMTFCITCPPSARHATSRSRWNRKEGTNIFIFKLKSRTRAYDWMWKLWRRLGGEIPTSIEVRSPLLDTRVQIDIPADNDMKIFTRSNIIALCAQSLQTVPNWKYILEMQLAEGKTLELAWRKDTVLDWIWNEDDVDGNPRDWAILCGLALKQPHHPCHLEIRLGEHAQSHIHVNGQKLSEPPSIEGYLDRIKPNTQMKQPVYLVTHDGNLFSLTPSNANPPSPPGVQNIGEENAASLRESEVARGSLQIAQASGVSDLRNILVVRRAIQLVPSVGHAERDSLRAGEDADWAQTWDQPGARQVDSDDDDEGGDEALTKASDKGHLRMKRSFELLLNSGNVIRFEAHSCKVAAEWVERLRALVVYWRHKHRMDARQQIDLADSLRPRLTPLLHSLKDLNEDTPPVAPVDLGAPLPELGASWCAISGCRPITKGGKIFMRRGLNGAYKMVQLFAVTGHLVSFRIKPGSSLSLPMKKKINLLDAYVCSGYFAALALPRGQYDASDAKRVPRRYMDGLETDDSEEDRLFVIFYRLHTIAIGQAQSPSLPAAPPTIPALSAKRKLVVFRTRSRLERDSWVWVLNLEIEKLVRINRERERKLREANLLNT